jgi:hypothetical protein
MIKFKHTPGKWKAVKGFVGVVLKWFLKMNDESDGILIGNEADTRLIAAAPEMLEALIKYYYTTISTYRQFLSAAGERNISIAHIENELKELIERATGLPIEEVLND